MGAGHSHGIEKPATGSAGARHRKSLVWALALTTTFLVVEVIGAWISGSLALLADAAHMLTDAGGLALALFAIWFAARPPSPSKTFGYLRAEVLAALINAVVLLLLAVYILYEAYQRIFAPPEVLSTPMLIVAVVGLVVNLISMRLLAAGSEESLNLKGAYFEVLADMLGSIGVIASALIIMFTGWTLADPIIGAAIGVFIVPRTWALLKHSVNILLEGTPIGFDLAGLERALRALPGVVDTHDLHVWTITSGIDAMSGHLVVADDADQQAVLVAARTVLHEDFGIDHTTIQIETAATRSTEVRTRV
ncbi:MULTISPECIES: cation diffusion facilitator family transporter [unclassified Devosia]|uniref:cation diffusion facilitator family transporter n=1 Tax=unclassified Devosia TaxID=196773 RepID=UPI00086DF7A4|nr:MULTISPECIES: cation diffusion facilitator family transporter [unclassified Devosia]MBN9360645.1 cation transporter [Devosia sp.]ODS85518.1 MAG: cation transporter [Devosia sp. SCN 66-27]OJX22616.1 MAG: cation transporter [Devosia sp. 66-14]